MDIVDKIKSNWDAYFLKILGVLTIGFLVLNLAINITPIDFQTNLILSLLGVLCLSVSIERLSKIDVILEKVSKQSNAELIVGKDSISNRADSLILTAKDTIYATSFGYVKPASPYISNFEE